MNDTTPPRTAAQRTTLLPDVQAEIAHEENGELADSLAWLQLSDDARWLRIRRTTRETQQDVKLLAQKFDDHVAAPRVSWRDGLLILMLVIGGGAAKDQLMQRVVTAVLGG